MARTTTNMFKARPRTVLGGRRALRVRAQQNWAEEAGTLTLQEGMQEPERYIAMNRFTVKEGGAGPKFEQRWATRKSSLAQLDGFRFFCLLRRVPNREGEPVPSDEPNYVSFTIWEAKKNFDDWYKSAAFKEAHGGGTIFGFFDTLMNSLMILRGAPKPFFWHGLSVESVPGDMSGKRVDEGWRVVDADGQNPLDAEAYVRMTRLKVAEGKEADFEDWCDNLQYKPQQFEGFKCNMVMRRDGPADDGYNYKFVDVFQDQASFEKYAMYSGGVMGPAGEDDRKKSELSDYLVDEDSTHSIAEFEGVLVLETPEGA